MCIRDRYGGPIKVVEITSDAAAGQEKLINKEVDVLAQFPADAYAEFRSGHPITLTVLVNEIDPVGADYAAYLVNALVTRINQDLVVQGLARARTLSAGLDEFSQDTLVRLDELDQALGNGDTATALQRLDELEAQVDAASVGCLLYTSDAADERSSVDLGGRRIIKKKNTQNQTRAARDRHREHNEK